MRRCASEQWTIDEWMNESRREDEEWWRQICLLNPKWQDFDLLWAIFSDKSGWEIYQELIKDPDLINRLYDL